MAARGYTVGRCGRIDPPVRARAGRGRRRPVPVGRDPYGTRGVHLDRGRGGARSTGHTRGRPRGLRSGRLDESLLATRSPRLRHADVVLGSHVPARGDGPRAGARGSRPQPPRIYPRRASSSPLPPMYTDETDAARPLLSAELARMEAALGDEAGRAGVLYRLSELELRAGTEGAAHRHAREAVELADVIEPRAGAGGRAERAGARARPSRPSRGGIRARRGRAPGIARESGDM